MKSTNMLERFNEEIKRRTRVVRIFPNQASCLRLVRALAVEQHERWQGGHCSLNMAFLKEGQRERLKEAPPASARSTKGIDATPSPPPRSPCPGEASEGGSEGMASPDPMTNLQNLTHSTFPIPHERPRTAVVGVANLRISACSRETERC